MATLAEQPSSTRLEQVLVAEADRVSLMHIQQMLTKSGYDIVVAHDGLEATQILQSSDPPPLAVLDWTMPGLDGIEVCRQLRQQQRLRHTYVILLTHWNEHNERVTGLEAGADDCLYKPVDIRELRLRLQKGSQILLERALRESEARFQGAFQCAGIGMALIKPSGEFLQANPSLCDFLGYTAGELLTRRLEDIGPAEEVTAYRGFLREITQAGNRSTEFETRLIKKDGTALWASLTISAILDSDDIPVCFVAQVQDIGERKRAVEALQRSEAFSRAITDNALDLIMVVTPEHKWIYASPSHLTTLGYKPQELIGRDTREILHPDDHPLVEEAAIRMVKTGDKNGAWRHMEASAALLRNPAGVVEGIIVVARGIDERIQAEQKLQAAHAETELFLQSIPSILIGLDQTGHITRWNHTAATTFGMSDRDALGQHIADCGIRWLHSDMKAEFSRWLHTETSCRRDDITFERDGEIRSLGLHVRSISNLKREGTVVLLTGADTTERKSLEDQLRQAQKLEAIGQLAAGVAHEINTPTQYVGDNTRFLKDSWQNIAELLRACQDLHKEAASGPVSPELLTRTEEVFRHSDVDYLLKEIPHAIDQSLEGVQRVAKIVRAMKEFSHPGSEEKKGINLNRAIETTLTVAKNEWRYIADVFLHFDDALPLVPCLAGEMNQVLLNLIVNAAHAIAEVAEESKGKGKITITTRRLENWVEVAIKDTGPGISEDIRSRVFEPFFTTKPLGHGTGQGLALAHSVIVNRHQGQIWFDSAPGQGATFFIRLPLEAAS